VRKQHQFDGYCGAPQPQEHGGPIRRSKLLINSVPIYGRWASDGPDPLAAFASGSSRGITDPSLMRYQTGYGEVALNTFRYAFCSASTCHCCRRYQEANHVYCTMSENARQEIACDDEESGERDCCP